MIHSFIEHEKLLDARKVQKQALFLPCGETANNITPYKFSAKEKDEETSYSYFGARYLASDFSFWLSVDPLSDKRSWLSPYNYCQWNPIKLIDPTGMLDWEPEVNKNGKTIYKPEAGDNKETFMKQYGIDNETADKIFKNANYKIQPIEGGRQGINILESISGEAVKQVTGSDILKLDWSSSQATDQRKVDQIMFGIKKSQVEGKDFLDLKDYNSNTYNDGVGFNAKNITINVGNGRILVNNFNVSSDWNTKLKSYGEIPKQMGVNEIRHEYRDPIGRFGAQRLLIRFNEKDLDKYRKYYY